MPVATSATQNEQQEPQDGQNPQIPRIELEPFKDNESFESVVRYLNATVERSVP